MSLGNPDDAHFRWESFARRLCANDKIQNRKKQMNTIEALREFKRLLKDKLKIYYPPENIDKDIEEAYQEILEKLIVTSNQHH